MICPNGTSRNFKRRRDFVTDAFQVRNHALEVQAFDTSNVFTNDPTGLDFGYKAEHFRPERTVILRAFALTGRSGAVGLAGKAAANDIGRSSASVKKSDVSIDRNSGIMMRDDIAAKGVNLTERDCAKTARAFKANAEARQAAEQIKDRQHDAPPKKAAVAHREENATAAVTARVRKETARGVAPAEAMGGARVWDA